jgi:phosphate transport system protein
MANLAAAMLKESLDAFTSEDADASREIIRRDRKIDDHYHRVFDELIQLIISKPETANGAARLLFVAKNLERIGDYVKDICELNVYLREAVFIKHSDDF